MFNITPSGALTTIFANFCPENFPCATGAYPSGSLVQGPSGEFYGTTEYGGLGCNPGGCGAVFKVAQTGVLTTLHSFDEFDGLDPRTGLIRGIDGDFYGTTFWGGPNKDCAGGSGCGVVFKMTPSGTLATLYSFCSQPNCTDGNDPNGLVQATDGNFYGTTIEGGANSLCEGSYCGTAFRLTPDGNLTTLHSFDGTDGSEPMAGLVQGTDGNFYGTTSSGGTNDDGTVFKITPNGTLTTLHIFDGADGAEPGAVLVQGTDQSLYGTTSYGSDFSCDTGHGCGTLFKITPSGTFTMLHSFDGTDGEFPRAGLIQDTNGTFYGTTSDGGTKCSQYGCGTIFSLSVGLGPFVKSSSPAGKVGATVGILGTDLTGASSVSFNGVATAFRVVSKTFIEAKVPSGATSGKIQVVTPNAILSSNVPFVVLK